MAFIIYKLYLNQYLKPSKFHSCWEREFVRLLPAGKGTLPCWGLQIMNLQTGDYWAKWGPSTWGRAVSKAPAPQPGHLQTFV